MSSLENPFDSVNILNELIEAGWEVDVKKTTPDLGLWMGEDMECPARAAWDRVRESGRRRARSIGIEAAMIVTAGSAVPKILMSTVVAVLLLAGTRSAG
jgi:hypothetical protein